MTKKSTSSVAVGVLLAVLTLPTITFTSAFSPLQLPQRSAIAPQQQQQYCLTRLMASEKGKMYPGMSQEEIATWMADIPVYAITSKLQLGGIVLLNDPNDTTTAAAYYFLNKDMAQATLQQMQLSSSKNNNKNYSKGDWQITPFSLGMIWFEVLYKPSPSDDNAVTTSDDTLQQQQQPQENIVHRLVADSRDLAAAREHVEQFANDNDNEGGVSTKFQKDSFNEVPVFMDLQMRILDPAGSGAERFPMYLSVRDMVNMCQDFMKEETNAGYKASVNIADLHTLVSQMKESSEVNFREALLIAPTPPVPPQGFVTTTADEKEASSGEEEPCIPSMNTDWS